MTDLAERPDVLGELVDRIDDFIASTLPSLTLAAARQACNETGAPRYKSELEAAIEQYAAAQEAKRNADHRLSVAKEANATAMTEAKWLLSGRFASRSNKQWLVVDDAGQVIDEADQRSYTASEKDEWLAYHAAQDATVKTSAVAVRDAEQAVRECADDLALRDRHIQALRHLLDASVVELQTKALALSARKNGEKS